MCPCTSYTTHNKRKGPLSSKSVAWYQEVLKVMLWTFEFCFEQGFTGASTYFLFIDRHWETWSSWSLCTTNNGSSTYHRTRTCPFVDFPSVNHCLKDPEAIQTRNCPGDYAPYTWANKSPFYKKISFLTNKCPYLADMYPYLTTNCPSLTNELPFYYRLTSKNVHPSCGTTLLVFCEWSIGSGQPVRTF